MSKQQMSIALRDCDHKRVLFDGRVQVDRCDPIFKLSNTEGLFFCAIGTEDFDTIGLSVSAYLLRLPRGICPCAAIPVFLSCACRHTSLDIQKNRIHQLQDLKGWRIGIPDCELTSLSLARAIVQDGDGVRPEGETRVWGGIEQAGRTEKIGVKLPDDVRVDEAPVSTTLSERLLSGDLDAFIAPTATSPSTLANPRVGCLSVAPIAVINNDYKRTPIFPTMKVAAMHKSLLQNPPWLHTARVKACAESKDKGLKRLADTSATQITLHFDVKQRKAARETLGADFDACRAPTQRRAFEHFFANIKTKGCPLEKPRWPSCSVRRLTRLFELKTYTRRVLRATSC